MLLSIILQLATFITHWGEGRSVFPAFTHNKLLIPRFLLILCITQLKYLKRSQPFNRRVWVQLTTVWVSGEPHTWRTKYKTTVSLIQIEIFSKASSYWLLVPRWIFHHTEIFALPLLATFILQCLSGTGNVTLKCCWQHLVSFVTL